MNKRKIGGIGEDVAVKFLESKGYNIVERNFDCTVGEIDIIARKDGYLVFIEVKYRKNLSYGYPVEAVTYSKQKNIRRVATWYIKYKNLIFEKNFRFDVVGMLGELEHPTISLIENAF
ncbi:MAG TPA: YraN family protein [Clostridiales bacterium]|nr:MAG: YraN family protein [Clostridiales bacterium GWD2_32_19]HCC07556.1 YraN family protein [Clostridiales bacterium]